MAILYKCFEVRMFLGTIGVCRIFIKDFVEIARPLSKLLRKDTPFVWGQEQEKLMAELRQALGKKWFHWET